MKINLYRVIHPVADIESSARFFAAVFDSPGERVSPGRHYFDCGGTILACYDAAADGDDAGDGWRYHDNQYLYFAVDDLIVVRNRLVEAGGTLLEDIDTMPWGERIFYAAAPDGARLAFVDQSTVFRGSMSTD